MLEAMRPSTEDQHPIVSGDTTPVQVRPDYSTISSDLLAHEAEFESLVFDEELEDVTRFKKIILDKYRALHRGTEGEPFVALKEGEDEHDALREYTVEQLNAFNEREGFFKTDDIIVLTGGFYGQLKFIDEDEDGEYDDDLDDTSEYDLYDYEDRHEIRGQFARFTIIDAPTNKEFARRTSKRQDSETWGELETHPSPAIRLINPVIITHDDNGETLTEAGDYAYIDIPLTYKGYKIERAR
jgi:hypothetical protein